MKKKKETPENRRKAKDVLTHLSHHPEIDSSQVSVDVSGNEIVLKGTIDNNRARDLAGNIVSTEVAELGAVINKIDAKRDMSEAPEDEQ